MIPEAYFEAPEAARTLCVWVAKGILRPQSGLRMTRGQVLWLMKDLIASKGAIWIRGRSGAYDLGALVS